MCSKTAVLMVDRKHHCLGCSMARCSAVGLQGRPAQCPARRLMGAVEVWSRFLCIRFVLCYLSVGIVPLNSQCLLCSGYMSLVVSPFRRRAIVVQVMVRKDADGGSALMLYRKKSEEALQAAEPIFIAAPPAEATTEVRPMIWKLLVALL